MENLYGQKEREFMFLLALELEVWTLGDGEALSPPKPGGKSPLSCRLVSGSATLLGL